METNPGPQRPVPAVCRILYSNVRGQAGNLSDLTVASPQYDILLCSETLVSDMRQVSEMLVPGFGRHVLLCRARCLGPVGWLHTFEMVIEHFANENLSAVVVKCWFLGLWTQYSTSPTVITPLQHCGLNTAQVQQ